MDKKEVKKKGRAKGSGERNSFSYEFSQIRFGSHEGDLFRATVSSVVDGVLIWLESKKTKQQWQATVTNVGECGPSGVPEDAVIAFLKKAFDLISTDDEVEEIGNDDPTVDFILEDGDASLILELSIMGGVWKPEFTFTLLPVGLEKIDVLEAKLRDAQEEIEALKAEKAVVVVNEVGFLSQTSNTACANQQIVVWNGVAPQNELNVNYFRKSATGQQFTILKTGVYQVQIRLAGTCNANSQHLGLQVNGQEVAQCTQSDSGNHQNTPQIFEVLRLNVDDILQVRCGANGNSLTVALANRLTILYLGV